MSRDVDRCVGVIGATSLVGAPLLDALVGAGWHVTAFSRAARVGQTAGVRWVQLGQRSSADAIAQESIGHWISLAPIWALPDHLPLLEACAARRVVALSSTSVVTKSGSADPAERETARRLEVGERAFTEWAGQRGVEWLVLRPTLVYGYGRDGNVSEIARFVRRFGFFPVMGNASGLRQPLHARDVAAACLGALDAPVRNRIYALSGGETLRYRAMVERIFAALGRRPRILRVPRLLAGMGIRLARLTPGRRHWSVEMAGRMDRDLAFDHADARRDLAFDPKPFRLDADDLPR